jgi:MFS family permease
LQLEAIPKDQLARFNGLSSSSFQAGQLIGIALAGVLLEYYDASVALFVNGISFVLAGFIIRFVSIKHSESNPFELENGLTIDSYHRRVFVDWADVARYLLGNRLVIALIMISSLDWVMASMANIYLVPLVEIQHGGSGFWLALCDGLFAVGALLSGFLVTRITDQIGYISAALLGFVFQSIAFLLLASSDQLLVMPSAMFVLGFFNTISWTAAMTLLQLNIDKNYRGRIALVRYMSGALFGAIAIGIITTVQVTSLNLAIYASAIIGLAFCGPPLLMLTRKQQLTTE